MQDDLKTPAALARLGLVMEYPRPEILETLQTRHELSPEQAESVLTDAEKRERER